MRSRFGIRTPEAAPGLIGERTTDALAVKGAQGMKLSSAESRATTPADPDHSGDGVLGVKPWSAGDDVASVTGCCLYPLAGRMVPQ
jgi:hypothetical protein